MAEDQIANDTRPASRPARALVVVPVALVLTAAARALDDNAWLAAPLVYGLAAGGAGLLGVPLLVWSLERGALRFWRLVGLGLLAGVTPIGLLTVSGVIGLFIRGLSIDYVRWFVSQRAPVPAVGSIAWSDVAGLAGEGALVGVGTAVVCWIVLRDRQGAPGPSRID